MYTYVLPLLCHFKFFHIFIFVAIKLNSKTVNTDKQITIRLLQVHLVRED